MTLGVAAPPASIERRLAGERPRVLGVFLIALAAYLALVPWVTTRLSPVTGDEPFYLMTAISILQDHDLDETNNYAAQEYHRFYPPRPLPPGWRGWTAAPDPLPPHPTHARRPGLYSKHGLGLALLVLLPFAVLGRLGAVLFLNVISAALAANVYFLARRSLPAPGAAALALLLALTLPIAPYAFLIFPEAPAALLIVYVARRLMEPGNRPWQWALVGAALGFLPWLHSRFLPLVLAAVALALARHGRRMSPRALVSLGAPLGALGAAYLTYLTWLYGRPMIPTQDHGGFNGLAGTVNGAFGLLLDAQWGLAVYAPVFLLALAALPWYARRHAVDAAVVLGLALPYLALVASYRVWWGEWCPPARYLVPIAPLAAAPLAAWLARAGRAGWWPTAALAAPGVVVTATGALDPQRLYQQPDGVSLIYRALGHAIHLPLERLLVSFQPYAVAPLWERALWGSWLVAVLASLALAAWGLGLAPVERGSATRRRGQSATSR